jgi:hypothetical protein
LGSPENWYGCLGEERKSLAPTRNWTTIPWPSSLQHYYINWINLVLCNRWKSQTLPSLQLWGEIKREQSLASFARVIQKLKIQNRSKWKRKNCREGFRPSCSQPRPLSQWFPFVFAFKETSGRQKFH